MTASDPHLICGKRLVNMIGEQISRYQILEEIGAGGMGVVYAAADPNLGRRVAIKLLETASDEPIYRARFMREARAISSLHHPNIAIVYDVGETSAGQPYIVMELVEGKTLSELLETDRLTLADGIDITIEIAAALTAAHSKGIIHRDIKPSNVMVGPNGEVKVLDFGLAKQMSELTGDENDVSDRSKSSQTQTGVVVGTPLYISPEQATSRPVDGRSDIFSLGVVLYECLAGRQPFYGRNALEIGAQVIHVDPPEPSAVNPDVTADLDRIAMKALAKDPANRYQTAAALAAELRDARAVQTAHQDPVPRQINHTAGTKTVNRMMAMTQTIRRKRVPLVGVAAILVIVLGGLWALPRLLRKPLHQPDQDVAELVERGVALMRNGEYQGAFKLLTQATVADPNYAIAHAYLAEVMVNLESVDLASRELLRANNLVPDRSALPKSQALYFEALSASITDKDPAGAIKSYKDMVQLAPADAKTYLDLGRAYERNNETKLAVDAYRQAADHDPKYATAFLRLGILYTRQHDFGSATDALARAEALFGEVENSREGLTEVLHKRGLLDREQGQLADARAQFEKALRLAQETGNISQQIYAMLDISSVIYSLGDATGAEKIANEGRELAQQNNLKPLEIVARVSIARSQSIADRLDEADANLVEAIKLSREYDLPYREQNAILNLAAVRLSQARPDDALNLAEPAEQFFENVHYHETVSIALTLICRAQRQQGKFDLALDSIKHKLQIEQDSGNQYEIGVAEGDLGAVLVDMEDYPGALDNYTKSYEIHRSIGIARFVGYAQSNRFEILWRLGEGAQAATALAEANQIADSIKASDGVLQKENLRANAEMVLSQGDFGAAQNLVAPMVHKKDAEIDTLFVRSQLVDCLAKTRSHLTDAGLAECRLAAGNAAKTGNRSLVDYAQLALAESLFVGDKMAEAASLAERSGEIFSQSKRLESEWRAWALAASANERLGNVQAAVSERARGSAALVQLRGNWGSVVFDEYRTRPDIQNLINSLGSAFPTASISN